MRLRNYTDIPDDVVRAIIRDVCPADVTKITVEVQNTEASCGRGWAYTGQKRILVKVPKTERQARRRWAGHGAYLPHDIGSRMELLVQVLAHEFRHQWQKLHPRGWRVWGARGRYSERDADAYGIQMLRRFRRGELSVKPAAIQVEPVKVKVPKPHLTRRARILNLCPPQTSLYGDDEVYAPSGKVWGSNQCHGMVFTDLKDLRESLTYGLQDCTNPDCDHCHPDREDVA